VAFLPQSWNGQALLVFILQIFLSVVIEHRSDINKTRGKAKPHRNTTAGIGIRIRRGIRIKNPYQMSRRDGLWLISGRPKNNNTISAGR